MPTDQTLDLELVRLPRTRSRLRPIMASGVIAICLTLIWRLWSDLFFYFEPDLPKPIALAETGDYDNHYVSLDLVPNIAVSHRVVADGQTSGPVLVPTMGNGGKLWLLLHRTPWNAEYRTDLRFRGRLRLLSDLPMAELLEKGFPSTVPTDLPLSAIKESLRTGGSLVGSAGDVLQVASTTSIEVEEIEANAAYVTAVRSEPYIDEASWTLGLEQAGLLPGGQGPISQTTDRWIYQVAAPDGVEAVSQQLRQSKLYAATASAVTRKVKSTWSELQLEGDSLLPQSSTRAGHIEHVAVHLAAPVATQAYLLDTSDTPAAYWYVPLLVGLLLLVALIFLLGLYNSIRD